MGGYFSRDAVKNSAITATVTHEKNRSQPEMWGLAAGTRAKTV